MTLLGQLTKILERIGTYTAFMDVLSLALLLNIFYNVVHVIKYGEGSAYGRDVPNIPDLSSTSVETMGPSEGASKKR